jgi:hypothetical protein
MPPHHATPQKAQAAVSRKKAQEAQNEKKTFVLLCLFVATDLHREIGGGEFKIYE